MYRNLSRHTCLAHSILETTSIGKNLQNHAMKLKNENAELLKTNTMLEESVRVSEIYTQKLAAELDTLRQDQPERERQLKETIERLRHENSTIDTLRQGERTSFITQAEELKSSLATLKTEKLEWSKKSEEARLTIEALNRDLVALRATSRSSKRRRLSNEEMDVSLSNIEVNGARTSASQLRQEQILQAINEMKKQIEALGKVGTPANTVPVSPAEQITKQAEPIIKQTYARILKDTSNDTKKIRHIDGKGDNIGLRTTNVAKFRESDDMKTAKTTSIRAKGTTSYTVTFETEEDAANFDAMITQNHNARNIHAV